MHEEERIKEHDRDHKSPSYNRNNGIELSKGGCLEAENTAADRYDSGLLREELLTLTILKMLGIETSSPPTMSEVLIRF